MDISTVSGDHPCGGNSSAHQDENSVLALLMMKDTSSSNLVARDCCDSMTTTAIPSPTFGGAVACDLQRQQQDQENSRVECDLHIPSVFQPKFMEVHDAYIKQLPVEYVATIPQHDHLLAVCLQHMVKFCCWARGSPETSAWINNLLFQNVDFRPELRNGLTMVMMYTFAASQAARAEFPSDLFSVVMDSSRGLGIFHKTSLRVYSDPFSFFNFLKMCLTGLIECGVLKENERVSQAVPKTRRRHFEVESELVAFNELVAVLIARLRDPADLQAVKRTVAEVVVRWQDKSLKIGRSRRFAVALQAITQSAAAQNASSQSAVFQALGAAAAATATASSTGDSNRSNGSDSPTKSQQHQQLSDATIVVPAVAAMAGTAMAGAVSVSSRVASVAFGDGSSGSGSGKSSPPVGGGGSGNEVRQSKRVRVGMSVTAPSNHNSTNSNTSSSPTTSSNGNTTNSSSGLSFSPALPLCQLDAESKSVSAFSSLMSSRISENDVSPSSATAAPIVSMQDQQHQHQQLLTMSTATATVPSNADTGTSAGAIASTGQVQIQARDIPMPSVCVLRCDRVGVDVWELHDTLISDVSAFFETGGASAGRIFAVDAACFTASERATKCLHLQSKGLISLEAELRHRGAVQTSWSAGEFPQLRSLIDTSRMLAWKLACCQGLNQVQVQGQLDNGGDYAKALRTAQEALPFSSTFRISSNTSISNDNNSTLQHVSVPTSVEKEEVSTSVTSTERQQQPQQLQQQKCVCLVYERVTQTGYLLRACPELGVPTDTWRMMYRGDVERCALSDTDPTRTGSFLEFLQNVFPQLRAAVSLRSELSVADSIAVSYAPRFGTSAVAAVSELLQQHQNSSDAGTSTGSGAGALANRNSSVPPPPQYLGTLGAACNDILSRVDPGASLHIISLSKLH